MKQLHIGPMKSGKSLFLITHALELKKRGLKIAAIRPAVDVRQPLGVISSRGSVDVIDCIHFNTGKQATGYLAAQNLDAIFIDEIMLFDGSILGLIELADSKGIELIAAGLDLDFRGQSFRLSGGGTSMNMKDIEAEFDQVTKHTSECDSCGDPAQFTQRLENGKPASWDAPSIEVEGLHQNITYESRCYKHHRVKTGKANK